MENLNSRLLFFGEYFVLKDQKALCFPLKDRVAKITNKIEREFDPKNPFKNFQIQLEGKKFDFNFPISAGMASSAIYSIYLSNGDINKAYEIEDMFHAKSSGVDIAGCISKVPIIFQNRKVKPLKVSGFKSGEGIILCYIGNREDSLKKRNLETQEKLNLFLPDFSQRVESVIGALGNGGYQTLVDCLKWNLNVQAELGILPKFFESAIEPLVDVCDALKIMGAGFGGTCFGLTSRKPNKLPANCLYYSLESFS